MAILVINNEDYSKKLKNFELTCKECSSKNVELEIDWASYPSASWFRVTTICKDCHKDEDIYDVS